MTKVLVVDDSALMRRTLSHILRDAGMEVEVARNGREAVERLVECEPDVVTLDVNMPEMDGLTSLSLMMQVRPTPVVMVSSLTEKGAIATLEALALGAVDVVAKPGGTISLNVERITRELVQKVSGAARVRMHRGRSHAMPNAPREPSPPKRVQSPPRAGQAHGLVLVGVSTGGPRTLEDILPKLPANFPWPVLVAQHMPPNFTQALARRMDGLCALDVREVDRPQAVVPGTIYIARGGTDLAVTADAASLGVRPMPESDRYVWHPSVSRMVETAMQVCPPQELIGVMLTGMGEDGAEPMAELHRLGGRTIAESEDTAVVFGMPKELIALGGATQILPSTQIVDALTHWVPAEQLTARGSTWH